MRTISFEVKVVKQFLKKKKIASLSEIKTILGTESNATVFRKLKELSSVNSYSHRGKYYTLKSIASFNDKGLWNFKNVWFSIDGTLQQTAKTWVRKSKMGYSCNELRETLGISVKNVLFNLENHEELSRRKWKGIYIYYTTAPSKKREQTLRREKQSQPVSIQRIEVSENSLSEELKASMILFFSSLDEKHRRLYAGLESLKLGHGGDRQLSELLNMDVGTISRGRQELFNQCFNEERIRKSGGGRNEVQKKRRKL